MFISFSLFAKQRERNEPKKEKARKRSLHFANAQRERNEPKKEKARKRSLHFANAQCLNVI